MFANVHQVLLVKIVKFAIHVPQIHAKTEDNAQIRTANLAANVPQDIQAKDAK
jgi:hypothetical protein